MESSTETTASGRKQSETDDGVIERDDGEDWPTTRSEGEDAVRQTTRTEREDVVRQTNRTEREDGSQRDEGEDGPMESREFAKRSGATEDPSERDGDSKRRDFLWFHRIPDQRRERQNRSGAMRECHVGASYQF